MVMFIKRIIYEHKENKIMIADHYIGRMLGKTMLVFTLVPSIIMWMAQSRSIITLIVSNDISFLLFLKLSAYMIPPLLPHLLPFSFALAAVFLIYKLYQNNEMTILWASGCSVNFLARPFLYSATAISLIILVVNIFVIPHISGQFRQEIFLVKTDLVRSLLKSGTFQTPTKDIKIFIKDIDYGAKINGFFLEDNSHPSLKRVFTAQKAILLGEGENTKILLLGGKITEIPKDRKAMPSLLEFSRFTINLASLTQKIKNNDTKILEDNFWTMIKGENARSQTEYVRLIAKAHSYITMALYPFVYAIIIIFVLLRPFSPRSFPVLPIIYVVFLITLTKIISSALQNFSTYNISWIIMTYIFPLSLLLGGSFYLFQKHYHSSAFKRVM